MNWVRVSRSTPCPVCQKPDGCLVAPDGAMAVCLRMGSDHPVPAQRGLGGWYHRLADSPQPLEFPDPPRPGRPLASPEDRHRVYQALIDDLNLTLSHRRHLVEKRSMTLAQAQLLGYASLPSHEERRQAAAERLADRFGAELLLSVPGFIQKRGRLTLAGTPGILIPIRDPAGRIQAFQVRKDNERKGKYAWLSSASHQGPSSGARVHLAAPLEGTSSCEVWITEGPLKADLSAQLLGRRVLAIPGVGAARDLPAVLAELPSPSATEIQVVVALDADWQTKPQVAQARARLAEDLARSGWAVRLASWPLSSGKGLDDLLQRGLSPQLEDYRVQASGPRVLEARSPGLDPPGPTWSVEELRRELPRVLDRTLRPPKGARPQGLLIRTPPGTGKTHAITQALNRMTGATRKNAAVFVPRHDLAESPGRERWTHVHGRGHPLENGSRPCAFFEQVQKVARLRISPSQACQACPLLASCTDNLQRDGDDPWYWSQFSQLGRVAVFPAEHLLHADFWSGASVLVLDDVDLTQLLLEPVRIGPAVLRDTLALLETPEYRSLAPAQPLVELLAGWLHHQDGLELAGKRSGPQDPRPGSAWLSDWVHWSRERGMELQEALDQALEAQEPELFGDGTDLRQVNLARPPRFVADLARVLSHELAQEAAGRPWNSRLTLRLEGTQHALELVLRRDLPKMAFFGKTLIVTNASATREDLEQLFPERDWEVFEPPVAVPEGVEVIQWADRQYGKTRLAEPPAGRTNPAFDQVRSDLEFLVRRHQALGHRMGAITHLPFEARLKALLPQLEVTGHFFGQRGSNAFQDCQALFVVGTPWPNPHDLVQQARALHWDGPILSTAERLQKRRLGQDAAGRELWAPVRTYVDPRLQRLLEARREEELFQAVGRARLFNVDTAPGQQLDLFPSGTSAAPRQRVAVYVLSGLPLRLARVQVRSQRILEDTRLRQAAGELQAQGTRLSRRQLAQQAQVSQRQAARWLKGSRASGSTGSVPAIHPGDPGDPLGRIGLASPAIRSAAPSPAPYRGPEEPAHARLSRGETGGLDRVELKEIDSARSTPPEFPQESSTGSGGSPPRSLPGQAGRGPAGEVDRIGRSTPDPQLAAHQAARRMAARGLPLSRRKLAHEAEISERQAARYLKASVGSAPAGTGAPRVVRPAPVAPERMTQAIFELQAGGGTSRRKLARFLGISERQAQKGLRDRVWREAG